jgi:hypothetical protein
MDDDVVVDDGFDELMSDEKIKNMMNVEGLWEEKNMLRGLLSIP